MELVKINQGEIKVAEDVMKSLKEFQVIKAEMDLKEKEVKQAILNAMEENNIKSFENDFLKVVYVAPSTRKSIDTDRLKEEGIYDLYLKENQTTASVRLSWK